jgi:hypothetical protein
MKGLHFAVCTLDSVGKHNFPYENEYIHPDIVLFPFCTAEF